MENETIQDEEAVQRVGNTLSSTTSSIISVIVFALYGTISQFNTGPNMVILLILLLLLFMRIQPELRNTQFLQQDGGFGLYDIFESGVFFAIIIIVYLLTRLLVPTPPAYNMQHPAEGSMIIFTTIAVGAFIVLTIRNDIHLLSVKGERFLGFGVVVPQVKKKPVSQQR